MQINFLDDLHLEDVQNPEHPSDFVSMDDHSILILRLPAIQNGDLYTISYAFIIKDEMCFVYDREKNDFIKIGSLIDMNDFLDEKTNELLKYLKDYYREVDMLEDRLYESSLNKNFMSKWLTFKKELSLIYRLIFDATLSFELFITYHKKYSTFEELAYADVYEHIERIRDLSKVSLDKLDHLYDFYRAKVDEKMNHNVYYLTLLSGIFLPLTLMSGFFGMNTGGLPFLNDPNGTLKVVLIAVLLELLIFIPFIFINMHKTKKYTHKKDSF